MKKVLILILVAGSLFAQERVLTLKESLEMGLQNSKDLKISQSKINYSDAKVSEINSQFLPQFKFYGNYTRYSDNIPAFEFASPLFPTPIRISEPLYNNYTFKLGFTQPIFTGFKLLSSRSAAKYNLQASKSDYSKEENEVAFNIYNAYWSYYKADEVRNVIAQTLKQIEDHLKDTRNFFDQGLVSRNDLLKLEVQYSNTQLMLIEAENNLNIAKISFNKGLGIDLDSQTKVAADEQSLITVSYDLSEIISEAINNRHELKSLAYRVEGSKEGINSARSSLFPSVYLTGNYNYSNPNQKFQPVMNECRGRL